MSNLTLELDAEALREATVQAMTGVLTPEVKEKILQKAITYILQPSTDSWNRGQTPLENALKDAILKVATQEAERLIKEDTEFSEKIKVLLRTTADKVFAQDQDKFAERIADAFVSSIRNS